ncbi:MAG TPA: radical SAM protein [Candidatus Omnitrophota bacterium]|nr:radical SAM protein [Candidatus Omnitrophota bacterium]HPS36254.1 radical SAM protein [Candidatus Omnitrophota bacterium]
MKILLLQPPVRDFYDTDIRLQPIGLAYLKAAVQKHFPSIEIIIKAYHHSRHRRTIPLPKELSYLKDFYAKDDKSPFSSFHHFYHFGTDFETIAEEVAKEKPDLVGISALFAPYYREALACAAAIKKRWPAPVILGGSFVSTLPELMLSHPAVDFVIRGEGERAFIEFLKAFKAPGTLSKIPNLGFKKNGKMIFNPLEETFPLKDLPFPDLSDLPKEDYLFERKPLCFIITSRGCPYRCSFCSVRQTFGHHYRRRSTENILAEMTRRYAEGYRVFDFEDDNFAFDKKETLRLCEKIAKAFPLKDVQLLAMNGICYWTLDDEILEGMRKAGFTHLNLSLVSTNAKLLKTARRPLHKKKYLAVVRKASGLGFKIVSYQILGLPGDTVPSMIRTLVFNAGLPILIGASPFYLIPCSPVAESFGAPDETDLVKARLTAMAIETQAFTRDDIYTLFITTRILNFLKGLPLKATKVPLKKALAAAEKQDPRSFKGAEILRKLFLEKKFYAATSKGFEVLPKFKPKLFFQLWRQLDSIQTQENKTIQTRGGVL